MTELERIKDRTVKCCEIYSGRDVSPSFLVYSKILENILFLIEREERLRKLLKLVQRAEAIKTSKSHKTTMGV